MSCVVTPQKLKTINTFYFMFAPRYYYYFKSCFDFNDLRADDGFGFNDPKSNYSSSINIPGYEQAILLGNQHKYKKVHF